MRRVTAAAGLAAMILLAAASNSAAWPHDPGETPCERCVYGPHVEKGKDVHYGSKQESFCLRKLTLLGWFHHDRDCPECEAPRVKNRLIKWETPRETVKMKCLPPSDPLPAGQELLTPRK